MSGAYSRDIIDGKNESNEIVNIWYKSYIGRARSFKSKRRKRRKGKDKTRKKRVKKENSTKRGSKKS